MIHKTNAARILDGKSVEYELFEYEVDESDLSAVSVALKCRADITQVYKTIVCECEPRGFVVACIQGNLSLDLKALARASGHKRCELLNLKDLEKITGYIRGGCSPIGMKKTFDTFIDERALNQNFIYISAGVRGKQLRLNPFDLIEAVGMKIALIAK
ncbi:Cys-tRNA(Pro) deacylase [Campylobacter sp. MOP51]|uniref:Cys-tRNA(Pro) deacylase n=1 Tax=Campylobacter canis TaxID=3378588 RepID=UPI003C4300CF